MQVIKSLDELVTIIEDTGAHTAEQHLHVVHPVVGHDRRGSLH